MEISKILCLDTSARSLTVGIARSEGGTRKYEGIYLPDCGLTHSEIMMKQLDAALDERGLCIADFDAFAAVVGPGSFTGLRIGVTTVRAVCQVTGKRAVAVNSLEVLAYHIGSPRVCAIDAMHGKLYYAAYAGDGRELCPPSVCERSEFSAVLERYPYPVYASCALEGATPAACTVESLCACCLDRAAEGTVDYRELQPLYVRSSQAEETLREKLRAEANAGGRL